LQPIDLKEHERAEILITSKSRWATEFEELLDTIYRRTKEFPPEEIESDITKACREIREK